MRRSAVVEDGLNKLAKSLVICLLICRNVGVYRTDERLTDLLVAAPYRCRDRFIKLRRHYAAKVKIVLSVVIQIIGSVGELAVSDRNLEGVRRGIVAGYSYL